MIESIRLKNFQSHRDTHLKLVRRVNVILGSSDSGKSAILRALRWLVWNRPQGAFFLSHWGKKSSAAVTVSTGDGERQGESLEITRTKSKSENTYTLDRGHDPIVFKAFGSEVPEDIEKALNIGEVNLQQQLDPPFLLSDSPGEIARYFNQIAHLDVIDRAMYNLQKWSRSLSNDLASEEDRRLRLEQDLGQYSFLDEIEKEVQSVEALDTHRGNLSRQIVALKEVISELEEIEKNEIKLTAWTELEKPVRQLTGFKEDQEDLSCLVSELEEAETQIKEKTNLVQAQKHVDSVLDLMEEQRNRAQQIEELRSIILSLIETNRKQKKLKENLVVYEERFHSLMPDECPLCGQEVIK